MRWSRCQPLSRALGCFKNHRLGSSALGHFKNYGCRILCANVAQPSVGEGLVQ